MKLTNKLPKRIKDRWVKALRSGEYTQGADCLYSDNGGQKNYCCLGVLGKLCGLSDTVIDDKPLPVNLLSSDMKAYPPLLRQESTDEKGKDTIVGKLASMNDSGKWSFKRIASYIEKYL